MLIREIKLQECYLVLDGRSLESVKDWPDDEDLPPGALKFVPREARFAYIPPLGKVRVFEGETTQKWAGIQRRTFDEFRSDQFRMPWSSWQALRKLRRLELHDLIIQEQEKA